MSTNHDMAVEWRVTADLSPHPSNPRTHSPAQLEQIFSSVSRFGWTVPLIIDENQTILAGHGRWEMATANNMERVPTITIAGLSEQEKRAYLIADNRLSENADWDIPMLLGEIEWLAGQSIEADTLGFSDADILALHSTIDDMAPVDPMESDTRRGFARIESSTEPTQIQDPGFPRVSDTVGGPSAELAATLVPFSLMLPVDDRERVYAVLNRVRGDEGTMAEALMHVIDAFDSASDEDDDHGQNE